MLDDLIDAIVYPLRREKDDRGHAQHVTWATALAAGRRCYRLGHADAETSQLRALADIRSTLGDDGTLTQDDLVDRLRDLARDAARYRYLRDAKIDDWSRDFVAACLCDPHGDMTEVKGEKLDADVDAAMARGEK